METQPVSPFEIYEIRIHGHLKSQFARWFDGMQITPLPDGDTLISGPLPDQSALFGLLSRVRDLGLALVSVNRREGEE